MLDDGRFYLKTQAGKLEAYLVAEGLRKLAMIARSDRDGIADRYRVSILGRTRG